MAQFSPTVQEGVFDFEDEVLGGPGEFPREVAKEVLERLAAVLPKGIDVDKIIHACQKCVLATPNPTLKDIGSALAQAFTSWEVIVRNSLGAVNKQECLTNIRHSFIVMQHHSGKMLIVDPNFRDSFTLGHSNERYTTVVAALPCVFVGTAAHLAEVVKIMSAEISDLYYHKSLSVPPWRQSKALLSRWLTSHKEDTPVGNKEVLDVTDSVWNKTRKRASASQATAIPAVCEPAKIICGFPAASVKQVNNDDYWVLKTSCGCDAPAFPAARLNDIFSSAWALERGQLFGVGAAAANFEVPDTSVVDVHARGKFTRGALNDGWSRHNDLKNLDGALKDRMWNFRKVKLTGQALKPGKDFIAV